MYNPRWLTMLVYNFMMFLFYNRDYQKSIMETMHRGAWAMYDDLITLQNIAAMPEQSYMTVGEMVVHSGYAFEEHKVLTDDGYILTLYRIPGKLSNPKPMISDKPKQPIQLQHGLFDQGGTWFFNEPHKSIPY